jgi:hypothetical protein
MPKWFFAPAQLLVVPPQSGIYCPGKLPDRLPKIITVPTQTGIYCSQDIIRN